MNNLTYERYLNDPHVREQIDKEVCRLRREAIGMYIAKPIRNLLQCVLKNVRSTKAQRTQKPAPLPRDAIIEATLVHGRTQCFEDAKGFEIDVRWGCLWITQDHDTADYVVTPGQTFRVTRNGMTLVHAMQSTKFHAQYRPDIVTVQASETAPRGFDKKLGKATTFGDRLRALQARILGGARPAPQLG